MKRGWLVVVAVWVIGAAAQAQLAVDRLAVDLKAKVDQVAETVLEQTGVPSASLAVVRGGQIVYTQAYGKARLNPMEAAKPAMRYSVGSISKQFTASAVLLLVEQGKLSLDDAVGKYLPDLTRASEVTIREILSHTSGYQDYWPEDYLMPPMMQPTTAEHILDVWGKKPLDFDPGTKWQYSNTNYVIAGRIVEKVSGEPLMQFLEEHIFHPLGMKEVWNSDAAKLGNTDAEGYIRYALGPPRPAPKEGRGWMFAAGELAMPAYDLAEWDISVMNRSLLATKSYDTLETSVRLKDGTDSHYGLGLDVRMVSGHEELEHSGEVSGFVSENMVFPEDKLAIAVLTNQDASSAAGAIGRELAPLLLGISAVTPSAAEAQARMLLENFQQGKIDRSLFTPWCNAYFNGQALLDFASSLAPLGKPESVMQTAESLRGGMTFRAFRVTFVKSSEVLRITTYTEPDGKLEQYLVIPASQELAVQADAASRQLTNHGPQLLPELAVQAGAEPAVQAGAELGPEAIASVRFLPFFMATSTDCNRGEPESREAEGRPGSRWGGIGGGLK
ncbi:MAG TPA: serine hydrolase domain-containing protein [Acidobacteriaceae bacterium]|jgi:CubicO group peptidase (beta-lactamase class C family)|nr:serine hydrolase domain-containing protein [Acidobacteriaceae bacterium]